MKIAVAGKGGSGKTTVAASMARALARIGVDVIAVDAVVADHPLYHQVDRVALALAAGLLPAWLADHLGATLHTERTPLGLASQPARTWAAAARA